MLPLSIHCWGLALLPLLDGSRRPVVAAFGMRSQALSSDTRTGCFDRLSRQPRRPSLLELVEHSVVADDDDDIDTSATTSTSQFFLDDAMSNNQDQTTDHSQSKAANSDDTSSDNELWKALLQAGLEGTWSLLKIMRWGLAQTLTASLPFSEQQILLQRLQGSSEKDDESATDEDVARGSVMEEAMAQDMMQERQEVHALQELEKKLKDAAEARVQSELRVQQYRLEQEKTATQLQEFHVEKRKLEKQVEAMKKSADNEHVALHNRRNEMKTVQNELDSMEALLQKRRTQQKQLEMVEQDLKSRAEQIRRAKVEEKKPPGVPHLSPKEYRSLSQEEKGKLKVLRETTRAAMGESEFDAATKTEGHPILGPVIADLGYKRIHLVSSGKLGTIPIWKKQRTYRNSRAKIMAAEKEHSMELGFPGIICLYEDANGCLSILDGQHRVGAMQALREKRSQQSQSALNTTASETDDQEDMFGSILVEVYPQLSNATTTADAHAEKIFLEINKAEPLKLVDMPGVASAADRRVISEGVERLQDQFPRMFSPSQRCRVPNVNMDNLRNAIFGANVLRRHKITTGKELYDWLVTQNASLGARYEGDTDRQGFVNTKAWGKASRNGFYLGLDSSWLYV